ncbi:hypothetical protein MHL30_21250, partial [Priestia flexa]
RGKRVAVAQWNERVQTNQKDWNSYCSSLRSNHFVMSQTLFYKVMVEKVTKKHVMFSDIFAVEFIYLV